MEDSIGAASFAQQRDRLLDAMTVSLADDPRFSAAWLAGSLGRGDADEVSDLDLVAVVADEYAVRLCARPEMISAHPPVERLALFARFGTIAFAYENHHNAPAGGAASSVLYADSGVIVDWVLIPQSSASRPAATRLLFARIAVPLPTAPPSVSQAARAQAASDALAFLWMMAAITAKYIIRGDNVFVVHWLEELARLIQDIKRQLSGEAGAYQRGSLTRGTTTRVEQIAQLRELCEQAAVLSPRVAALGGDVWPLAPQGVERWLRLAEGQPHHDS